ncbi:hypothetical protein BPT24_242 [Tenacibaculum phage pT24]|uniref:Uncharacterized protein n=1 Tax=Tenacibaculum phage pT24 TaxID=1880590 RepID=A0A1B4XX20_9CAUD|nr:hypothetical protein HYP10_gp286 [Tenacibaculum phage pT24]BAV39362.1 hypothetical protein BPT24_242 [Tenacibaculum phage pT24]
MKNLEHVFEELVAVEESRLKKAKERLKKAGKKAWSKKKSFWKSAWSNTSEYS